MADLKKELAAHNARAKRAEANIARSSKAAADGEAKLKTTKGLPARRPIIHAIQRARQAVRHNLAVRNIERLRAKRTLAKIEASKPTRGEKAIRRALKRVGVHEIPAGSNSGPFISDWIRQNGGEPGYAWCAYFVSAMVKFAGGPDIHDGYTPSIVQSARRGSKGLSIAWERGKTSGPPPKGAGLIRFWKFPGVSGDFCDHTGLDIGDGRTVEGNTSPGGTSGVSQSNGGGVYVRDRGDQFVVAVVDWRGRKEKV